MFPVTRVTVEPMTTSSVLVVKSAMAENSLREHISGLSYMNQAVFEKLWIINDEIAGVDLQSPYAQVLA